MADIKVIKRDGSLEDFEVEKISSSIMGAAMEVGGEDIDLANEIADLVLGLIEVNEIEEIDAEDLQRLVEKTLIEEGHAATATQYILKGADRSRMREMDSALMKSFEEITFKSEAESEIKRENANIDSSTAMGTMLKYGSEGAKKFNLLYMMSKDIAKAHTNCDIHIHDLDFLTLTETCISRDMHLVAKEHDSDQIDITAEDLYNKYNTNDAKIDEVIDTREFGLKVKSGHAFTDVYNIVAHNMEGKTMLRFVTSLGEFHVTNDHLVPVQRFGSWLDIRAEEVTVGDMIFAPGYEVMVTTVPVEKIETMQYDGLVYDLQTANNYFNINGFHVHNCLQIPLDKLFKGGFNTGHGFLREPGNIRTASALAAIAIQSNQNDQHGGQSIPMFDYYLAPYVALSYVKAIAHSCKIKLDMKNEEYKELKSILKQYHSEHKLVMNDECKAEIIDILKDFFVKHNKKVSDRRIKRILSDSYDDVYDETFQAMEAFIHNLNTMHCLPASELIWVFDCDTTQLRLITMQELYDNFKVGRYKAISVNKETGKSEFKFITACKNMGNNRTIVEIKDNQGRTVRVTDNHRLMTVKNLEIAEDIPENCDYTISPKGISFGDESVKEIQLEKYGKPRPGDAYQKPSIKLNEKLAEFIGYYVADGSLLDDASTCSISTYSKISFKHMEELLVEAFNCKFETSYTSDNTTGDDRQIQIQIDTHLSRMLADKFGKTSKDKHISFELMSSPDSVKKAFLKAYFKLNGKKDKECVKLSIANKQLQLAIALMITSLGASSHYSTEENADKESINHIIKLGYTDAYNLGIIDSNDTAFEIPKYNLSFIADQYREECTKIINGEQSKILRFSELDELITKYELANLNKFTNIFVNDIISKDSYNSSKEDVYDISVEDNENFLTGECIFVHNSRAGAQTPFSSINYGTDTSTEGRMIMETILKTTWDGLGSGETPIFPIQIFKLKAGVSFNPGDPNYDLFKLACKVSAKRLYPNFVNLDAPYNAELYIEGRPDTEMATMGCRTRVGKNIYDPNKSIIPGRGNLSFTSINLPRLGIKAHGNIDTFFKLLDQQLELVHRQLLERFNIQCKKHPVNYPFLMGQGCWLGSEYLGPNDDIREILKHGTLTVGFIGLAETLVALIGKHHGESAEAQELGLRIVQHMRDYTDAWSENEHMNYSVIGTPAEGLSGRFIRADKQEFGIIPGVTDREYYTNSSHVPVYYNISATKKIDIEAPYHSIENGGHILYIEMDGDPTTNLKAFERVVRYMHDKNAGYMAINHSVDMDTVCNYVGVINDVCPRCGRREGEAMTMEMWQKIKGYANVGNANTLGYHGDPKEEADRKALKL